MQHSPLHEGEGPGVRGVQDDLAVDEALQDARRLLGTFGVLPDAPQPRTSDVAELLIGAEPSPSL